MENKQEKNLKVGKTRHGTEENYFKKQKPLIIILKELKEEIISFFKK